MALPSVVDSLDGVPEALHEHYAESNGQYVLDHLKRPAVIVAEDVDNEVTITNMDLPPSDEFVRSAFLLSKPEATLHDISDDVRLSHNM